MNAANRDVAAVGRQATAQSGRAPSYTNMYRPLPTAAGPAEQALDLTANTEDTQGFLFS